nr:hypothetical protein [Tanacetum cinerariifolium]
PIPVSNDGAQRHAEDIAADLNPRRPLEPGAVSSKEFDEVEQHAVLGQQKSDLQIEEMSVELEQHVAQGQGSASQEAKSGDE